MKKLDEETPRNSGLFIGSEPLEDVHNRSAAKQDDDGEDSKVADTGDDDLSDGDTTDTDTDTTDKGDRGDDARDSDGKD